MSNPIEAYKGDIYRRVFALFDNEMCEATLEPGVYENVLANSLPGYLMPASLFVLAVIAAIHASNQYTNGWWLISGYCAFLGFANMDQKRRAKQIMAVLRGNWWYILLMYFLNPIAIILFIIHIV